MVPLSILTPLLKQQMQWAESKYCITIVFSRWKLLLCTSAHNFNRFLTAAKLTNDRTTGCKAFQRMPLLISSTRQKWPEAIYQATTTPATTMDLHCTYIVAGTQCRVVHANYYFLYTLNEISLDWQYTTVIIQLQDVSIRRSLSTAYKIL